MSKKMKVLVAGLVAVIVLTVGGTAVVMAQDEPTPETEANGFLARVARILNISQEDLGNAFRQAQQEMRQEAQQRSLDKAVEEGLITQEEANEWQEWWGERPESCDRLMQHARIRNVIRNRLTHRQGIMSGQGGQATPSWLAE